VCKQGRLIEATIVWFQSSNANHTMEDTTMADYERLYTLSWTGCLIQTAA